MTAGLTIASIRRIALSYGVTALIFLTLDFAWLSLTSARLYQPLLSPHLAVSYDWKAVALFYPLYFIGITLFAVRPLYADGVLCTSIRGVLFGVIAYGVYDLTNQATLSGWPWALTLIDMIWGGFATGCAAFGARIILILGSQKPSR